MTGFLEGGRMPGHGCAEYPNRVRRSEQWANREN